MLNQKPTPDPLELLNSLERLALSIVGELALEHHLRQEYFETDNMTLLVNDVKRAIMHAMPRMDSVEIQRLCEGRPIDDDEGANAAWIAKQKKRLKLRNDRAFAMATAQLLIGLELGSKDFSTELVEKINRYAAEHRVNSEAMVRLCMDEFYALRRRLNLPGR